MNTMSTWNRLNLEWLYHGMARHDQAGANVHMNSCNCAQASKDDSWIADQGRPRRLVAYSISIPMSKPSLGLPTPCAQDVLSEYLTWWASAGKHTNIALHTDAQVLTWVL